ncbi:hypothetical protein [Nonomuraea sp. NPDC050310]|uniref:hypothetical protein n=1 Tax=unclassified Nonomuraea TaxID=2593643 RepID=UPI0033C8BFAE
MNRETVNRLREPAAWLVVAWTAVNILAALVQTLFGSGGGLVGRGSAHLTGLSGPVATALVFGAILLVAAAQVRSKLLLTVLACELAVAAGLSALGLIFRVISWDSSGVIWAFLSGGIEIALILLALMYVRPMVLGEGSAVKGGTGFGASYSPPSGFAEQGFGQQPPAYAQSTYGRQPDSLYGQAGYNQQPDSVYGQPGQAQQPDSQYGQPGPSQQPDQAAQPQHAHAQPGQPQPQHAQGQPQHAQGQPGHPQGQPQQAAQLQPAPQALPQAQPVPQPVSQAIGQPAPQQPAQPHAQQPLAQQPVSPQQPSSVPPIQPLHQAYQPPTPQPLPPAQPEQVEPSRPALPPAEPLQQPAAYPSQSYQSADSGYHSLDSGFPSQDSGYPSADSAYPSSDSGYQPSETLPETGYTPAPYVPADAQPGGGGTYPSLDRPSYAPSHAQQPSGYQTVDSNPNVYASANPAPYGPAETQPELNYPQLSDPQPYYNQAPAFDPQNQQHQPSPQNQQGGTPFTGYSGQEYAQQPAFQVPEPPVDPRSQQLMDAYQQASSYQQNSGAHQPMNIPDYGHAPAATPYDDPFGHPQTPLQPAAQGYPQQQQQPQHQQQWSEQPVDSTVRLDPSMYRGDALGVPAGQGDDPIDPTAIYTPDPRR